MNRTDLDERRASAFGSVPQLGVPREATNEAFYLAEGPLWDSIRERIIWIDIDEGSVYVGELSQDGAIEITERVDFPGTVGAVAVADNGDWLVAGTHRLYVRRATGETVAGPEMVAGSDRRLNDGKPDHAGRFVVGTKGPGPEQLMQIGFDGTVSVLDDDLTLSNGMAWTSDGRTFYSADTMSRRIYVRGYDPASGQVGPRRTFFEFDDGYPDGMTIDSEDCLWVAVWSMGCVVRISSSGEIIGRIDFPAPNTTCPVFAGPDLDTLVVTTAQENLSPDELTDYPLSGRLFTAKIGHRGVQSNTWAGRPQFISPLEEDA